MSASPASVPSPETLTNSGPHPILTKIIGRPDFNKILQLQREACANAASYPVPTGNLIDNALPAVVDAAECTMRSGQSFVAPINP